VTSAWTTNEKHGAQMFCWYNFDVGATKLSREFFDRSPVNESTQSCWPGHPLEPCSHIFFTWKWQELIRIRKTGFSRVRNYCKTAFLRVFPCVYLQSNPKESRGMQKLKKTLTEHFRLNRMVKCSLVQDSSEGWVQVFVCQRRFMRTCSKCNVMAFGQQGQ